MIEVTFSPNKYKLSIKGHAGYSESDGKDIVCSAASALFYTLVISLEGLKGVAVKAVKQKIEPGDSMLECKIEKAYESNVALVFWTVLNGFKALSESYSENVSLNIE